MPHAPRRPKDCSPDFPASPARPGYLSENRRGGALKVSRGLSAFGGVARRGRAPSTFPGLPPTPPGGSLPQRGKGNGQHDATA
jgi:hypothetical protein